MDVPNWPSLDILPRLRSAARALLPSRLGGWPTIIGMLGSLASVLGLVLVLSSSDNPPAEREISPPAGGILTAASSDPVQIVGSWDLATARSLVLDSLAANGGSLCEEPCTRHDILGDYYLRHRSGEAVIVVTASTFDGYDCHACGLPLSFFEFRKVEGGWRLASAEIGRVTWGAWGSVDPSMVKVFAIGADVYGVVLELGDMQMGQTVTVTRIFAPVLDDFREVLFLQTSNDDSGSHFVAAGKETIWTAEIAIEERQTGFYDLVVIRRGVEDGEPFEERLVYKFNGREYVPSDVYR